MIAIVPGKLSLVSSVVFIVDVEAYRVVNHNAFVLVATFQEILLSSLGNVLIYTMGCINLKLMWVC